MSDNVIEIRITGAVDSSLAASVSQAKATLGSIGDQTTVTASAMSEALKAVSGDIGNLASELRSLGSAAASAGGQVASGLSTAAATTRGLGSAATNSGTQIASGLKLAEDATNRLHFATAGAIQDYFRLGQQAASGDFAGMAGTLGSLASETGLFDAALTAMGTEAAIATGGLALVAGALGYLAYQEYQADQNLDSLTEAFALTGRGATITREAVAAELDELKQMPHVTDDIAEAIVRWEAAHAEIDDRINMSVNQLLPQFAQAWGQQAPAAIGNLKSALQEIMTGDLTEAAEKFEQVNLSSLHFSQAIADNIVKMIRAGDRTEAWTRVLTVLANQGGGHFETIKEKIASTEQKLADAKATLESVSRTAAIPSDPTSITTIQMAAVNARKDVINLEAELGRLKKDSAKPASVPISAQAIAAQLQKFANDASKTEAQILDEQVKYLQQQEAREGLSVRTREYIENTLAEKQAALVRKKSADDIQQAREADDALGLIGEARVRREIATDKHLLENKKLDAQHRENIESDLQSKLGQLHELEARSSIKAGEEAREAALRSLQEQAQDFRQGTQERVDADRKWLDYAIKAFGEYSTQAKAANDAIRADQRALIHQLIEDSASASEKRVKDIDETADEQMKALDEERKYFNKTAEAEMAGAKAIEDTRHNAAMDALNNARVAAGDEKDIVTRVDKEIEEEVSRNTKRLSDIRRQGLDQQVQDWSRFNSRITSAEDELVGDIFQANQSLWQSLRQIGVRFLQQMISDDVKYWTERILLAQEKVPIENAAEHGGFTYLVNLLTQRTAAVTAAQGTQTGATAAGTAARNALGATENTGFLGRIAEQIAQWLRLETAKTAETTAGTTARDVANATESVATIAAAKAQAAAEIPAYTGIAAMEAASAVASIPFVGPALAAAAVAQMDALGTAQLSLAAAEGGMESVDRPEQLIIAHRRESILPARIAVPLMSFAGALPAIADIAKRADFSSAQVGSLLPVASPGATVRAVSRAPQSDADYVASRVGGGTRASTSPSSSPSRTRGGDIHIYAWDASSMNQFFRKPSNRRTMDQISKDRVRAGFLPA